MPTITVSQLRGLILSANDLSDMNPGWTQAMISDYLAILENILILAEGINLGASKLPSAPEDNIIVFDPDGDLKDSGESIDTIRARAYFYGRTY